MKGGGGFLCLSADFRPGNSDSPFFSRSTNYINSDAYWQHLLSEAIDHDTCPEFLSAVEKDI